MNDILSDLSFKGCSQGVAFVANRIGGAYRYWNDERVTPICRPHSIFTEGGASSGSGNHVFINNILAYHPKFDKEEYPSRFEDNWMVAPEAWRVDDATGSLALVNVDVRLRPDFKAVDAKRLGKPCFVNQIFPEPSVMHPKNPLTNTLTGENQ